MSQSDSDRRRDWAAYWERFRETHSDWQYRAERRWGQEAIWIVGDGPYALLAPCPRGLTVTLWPTREEAEAAKALIDEAGCGGRCYEPVKVKAGMPPDQTLHQIIDMRERRRRRRFPAALRGVCAYYVE